MKPALVLVDWQRDFLVSLHGEPGWREVVARAAVLLRACRAGGVPVIHARLVVDRDPDSRMPHWKERGRWACVRGTAGAEPPDLLREEPGELVVEKRFFRAFADGRLREALDAGGIDTVVLSGLFLHACVRAAALDAYELGRRVWIAEDAVASDRPLAAAETRAYLGARGIGFAPAGELVAMLAAGGTGGMAGIGPGGGRGAGEAAVVVGEAVGRARRGLATLREASPDERVVWLRRLAAVLEEASDELAEAVVDAVGKPIRMARGELARCGQLVEAVCRRVREVGEEERWADGWRCRRVPLGVVAMVTPWNHPLAIPVGKLAPAILHGNAVVWKPAPAARGVAERLMARIAGAGWPEGWLTLAAGGAATAAALMRHPDVAGVTLTGGSAAGFAAQCACAERRIPLQAELGGNNAAIVWPDADLDEAAAAIALGAFGFAGQRCTANRRVIVEASAVEDLLERLARATAALAWGDPRDDATVVGPLVSPGERARVAAVVDRARDDGLPVRHPHLEDGRQPAGWRGGGAGAWYPPTIVVAEDPGHEIVQDETFGPVLVVQPASDWDEALALCNGVRDGLVAAVFTRDADRRADFLRRAEAGVLKVNATTADVGVEAPFGGWKASGVGPPEHGSANREFHTRWQAIRSGDIGDETHSTGGPPA